MSDQQKIEVRFGDWISEGWKMFTEQWKSWVTLSLGVLAPMIVPVICMVVFYFMMFATMLTAPHPQGAPPQMPIETLLLFYLIFFVTIVVTLPVTVLFMGGAYRAAFKQLRGGRVQFSDLFSARDCYWRLLGATIIQSILTSLGMLVCVIPGFIVAGMLFFTVPLIIERKLGVFEAMRASREVTQRNLLMFTLFALVVQIIASVGAYACYIGLLATWPLMFTMHAVAYRDCFGLEGARCFLPPAPSPESGYAAPPITYAPVPVPQLPACSNCQTPLPATAQFCPRCGANVPV
jgi:hypothetical protein